MPLQPVEGSSLLCLTSMVANAGGACVVHAISDIYHHIISFLRLTGVLMRSFLVTFILPYAGCW